MIVSCCCGCLVNLVVLVNAIIVVAVNAFFGTQFVMLSRIGNQYDMRLGKCHERAKPVSAER